MLFDLYRDLKDFYRSRHLSDLDWITQNRLILKKNRAKAKKSHQILRQKSDRKKLLFWSTSAWERGSMEHMLAYALYTRGHEIHGMTCDGEYPTCSMESVKSQRPACDYCHKRNRNLLDVFSLEKYYTASSELISPRRIQEVKQEVDDLSIEDLKTFVYRDLELGRVLVRDLPQYFFSLATIGEQGTEDYSRKALSSMILYSDCAYAMIEKVKPDIGVLTSGKTNAFAPFYELCQLKGIPVVTWDECGYEMDGFVFRVNGFANEYHLQDIWDKVKDEPLDNDKKTFVKTYLAKMRKGDVGTAVLYKEPIADHDVIFPELKLSKDKKLVVLMANITWDTSSLGRDIAFESMLDWICKTIDFYQDKPAYQLVIRCHPSEGDAPVHLSSDDRISDRLEKLYPSLPEHIKVIPGSSGIKSQELCELSHLILVYTTFVGLEMAAQGRRVVVSGEANYRNKGFTIDVESIEQYNQILSDEKNYAKTGIDDQQLEYVWRYIYTYINRVNTYLPEFQMDDRHSFKILDPDDFLPGGSDRWDALCDDIINQGLFIDCSKLSLERVQMALKKLQQGELH